MRPYRILLILAPVTIILGLFQLLFLALDSRYARLLPVHYHRFVCRLLNIRVTVEGELASERPLLLACNHVSWLDIPILSTVGPVSFIAKREVAGWPVFGWLAKLQRSVFIDRTRRTATRSANAEIAGRLSRGDIMVLFAEGTSSDGNRVLPFRSALIGAARDAAEGAGAHVTIQPMSIAYTGLWGLPMGRLWRPRVAWYGDVDLVPHLWGVLQRGAIDVTVTLGPAIAFDQAADRKQVTRQLEGFVREATLTALTGRPRDVMEPR